MNDTTLKALQLADRILQRDGAQSMRGELFTDGEYEQIHNAALYAENDTLNNQTVDAYTLGRRFAENGHDYVAQTEVSQEERQAFKQGYYINCNDPAQIKQCALSD